LTCVICRVDLRLWRVYRDAPATSVWGGIFLWFDIKMGLVFFVENDWTIIALERREMDEDCFSTCDPEM
jgi:hypothetical protein